MLADVLITGLSMIAFTVTAVGGAHQLQHGAIEFATILFCLSALNLVLFSIQVNSKWR